MAKESDELYATHETPVPDPPAPGQPPAPWGKTEVVGKPLPRVDGYERVSGKAVYPSDVVLPNMLYGAILRCPHPHAKVKSVDVSGAKSSPGVHAVIRGADPDANLKWTYTSGKNEIATRIFESHCRFEGEPVAAVAAETPWQAWDAIRAIQATYEVLPCLSDERKALDAGAPQIHENGNLVGQPQQYQRGDVKQGFAEADEVLEMAFDTASEFQTPLEPHGCVANWEGDRLTLWESTQGVYAIQKGVAAVLGLPLSKVRVIGSYMGGGFGSKLRANKYDIIAAILSRRTNRPVKLFLTREETFLVMGNRPPSRMKLKAGVKKDGTVTALEFSCLGTGGAYPAGGTSLVDWLVRDLYLCPNVRTETTDVYINAGPARPMRAPGHPQGAWALEQMMDALADKIGMDPVDLRLKNIPEVSQARDGSPPYTSTGLRQCLEEGAKAFGWKEARMNAANERRTGSPSEASPAAQAASPNQTGSAGQAGAGSQTDSVRQTGQAPQSGPAAPTGPIRRGVGVAAGLWFAGGGGPPSTIVVKLFADGSVNLNMGASDLGTGTKTVMAMVVAEELGVRPETIQIESADTGTTQYATSSGGSKTIPTESPAVRAAAIEVKRRLFEMASQELKTEPRLLEMNGGTISVRGEPGKKIRIIDLEDLKKGGVIIGVGYRGPNPANRAVNPFAAQFCEVEVNTGTGEARVLRFLSANDSGRVMNRLTYDSQVIGGVAMGIGFAMTEQRILDRNRTGKLVNGNWHDYKLPTAMDSPLEVTSLPVEPGDADANTAGAKGLGEPVTIPTAAAVANAVFHATGVRVTETPMNPVRLCALFAGRKKEG